MTSSMDGAVAKYVISVNTLIKADFLESENLGREPFVLGGNAGQREIWRHAIRLTCFLGTAHLRFQRRKLVDNCSSSELTWCYWPLPGCHGISSSLQISVDVTLKISREYRREYPSLRPTCSAVVRTCCRAGGVLGTTVVEAVRQVPLAEEPLRSRCLLLPTWRFCVTRHGKIFRIFTDIFRGIHTWACRKSPEGRNFLDEDERKCLTYCNWRGAKTQTKPRKRCQVDLIINKLQKIFWRS